MKVSLDMPDYLDRALAAEAGERSLKVAYWTSFWRQC